MSKYIGRKQRWHQQNARQYTSNLGKGWFGQLEYKMLVPVANETALPSWLSHIVRLGPFKRPRNAMIAVEREAVMLRNRHGEHIRFDHQDGDAKERLR